MKKLILLVIIILSGHVTVNAQWVECTNGLTEQGGNKASVNFSILKDSILYAAVYYYGNCSANGIYISSDNGDSWVARNSGLDKGFPLLSIVNDGNNMFTGGLFTGMFLSSDSGKSWKPKNSGLKNNIVRSFTLHNNEIYVGLDSGIYSSSDNGDNWVLKGLGNTRIYSLLSLENNIFAGIKGGQIFRSSNDGKSWNYSGLSGIEVRCLFTRNKEIFAGTWDRGIYHSSDFGKNWNYILPGKTVLSLAVIGKNIFAGAFDDGMFLSIDNGATWKAINNGLNNNYIVSLLINGDYIFAGTQDGLYRAKLSDFVLSEIENDSYMSNVNFSYPNPALSYITLSLPIEYQTSQVKIYSIEGITVFETEYLDKIDVSRLASGVYYVRVKDKVMKFVKI